MNRKLPAGAKTAGPESGDPESVDSETGSGDSGQVAVGTHGETPNPPSGYVVVKASELSQTKESTDTTEFFRSKITLFTLAAGLTVTARPDP